MESSKILITGAGGLLGRALLEILPKENTIPLYKKDCDITDKKRLKKILKNLDLDVLIHCAAYTDVDNAQKQKKEAILINKYGTKNILDNLDKNCLFIYISTAYVFDGKKTKPYTEKDKPSPINIYGLSKLEGEKITMSFKKHLIIRTNWLFGPYKKNFVDTIIESAKKNNVIKIDCNQIGSPTYTLDLANAIKDLIEFYFKGKLKFGIYNITNNGSCNRFDFAVKIIKLLNLKNKIEKVILDRPAKRPKNSLLSNKKFYNLTGYYLRNWQDALKSYLKLWKT